MYTEVEHTADYSVLLSAADLSGLFGQAVEAVIELSGVETGDAEPGSKNVNLQASDLETLLVSWLEELLYSLEIDHQAWEPEEIRVSGCVLHAVVRVFPVHQIHHSIKAVTFHRLEVTRKTDRWETVIVFDA